MVEASTSNGGKDLHVSVIMPHIEVRKFSLIKIFHEDEGNNFSNFGFYSSQEDGSQREGTQLFPLLLIILVLTKL